MDRRYRLTSSVILSAALLTPVGVMAVAQQQEEVREQHDEHTTDARISGNTTIRSAGSITGGASLKSAPTSATAKSII